MSTNPNSALGTNGAYGGRTSVDAFNDVLQTFNGRGVLSGFKCSPSSGMNVTVGGATGVRDVAIAEDPNGNRTTINNISGAGVSVKMATASTSSARTDVIVAYVNKPAQVSSTTIDNPSAVGIIAVVGTAGSSAAPTDSKIRTAIASDGGTGSTAYYTIIATITIPANTTTITSSMITQGASAHNMVDVIYPVGSIYMSVNGANPATLFGGTWTQIQDRFILAAGSTYSAGATGGNATHTHSYSSTSGSTTLTAAQSGVPAHTHPAGSSTSNPYFLASSHAHSTDTAGDIGTSGSRKYPYMSSSSYSWADASTVRANSAAAAKEGHTHSVSGTTGSSSSLPPYLAVYVWQRTA